MIAIAALVVGWGSYLAPQERTLSVFAAASLRESFTNIARRYEAGHPGLKVRLSFAGSQQLAAQIRAGAEADVFAAAAEPQLRAAGMFASPIRTFAQNTLVIVVPPDERRVGGLADVAKVDRVVMADPSVPAGAYTLDVLNRARVRFGAPWRALVDRRTVSREQDVRAVLAKVVLGEADAGFVYTSDARSAGTKVRTVPIPLDFNVVAAYPVAVPVTSRNARDAKDFVQFLFTAVAQRELEDQGFVSPLHPIRELKIIAGLTTKAVMTDHLETTKLVTVRGKADDGSVQTFRGASLVTLLSGLPGTTVRFFGADGAQVDVPIATIRKNGGVLVPMGDGNVQAVLPGQSSAKWVRWLRRIIVR